MNLCAMKIGGLTAEAADFKRHLHPPADPAWTPWDESLGMNPLGMNPLGMNPWG